MAVPYTFGSATTSIPLSQLDSNFATTITLGNTAVQLGNTITNLTGVSNVASATSLSLGSNGNTTAITVDTSQNVGIGITNPSGTLHVKAQAGQGAPLYLSATDAGGNVQTIFAGVRTFQIGTGNTSSGFANNLFVYDGTAGATVLQQGRSTYSLALQGASPVVGTGISFPATQNASSDANTLDDYEEGTWTPTQGSNLTVVGTFSSGGNYTKIGRMVYLAGYVTSTTSVAATAGGVIAGGLPFGAITIPQQVGSGIVATTGSGGVVLAYSTTVYTGNTFNTATYYFNIAMQV